MKDKKYYIQLGIAVRVPIAFGKFCDESYELKKILPKGQIESNIDGKIQTTFEIYTKDKVKVATFHPSGEYHCLVETFHPIFELIVEDLNYGAYKAAQAQDEIHDKMTKEFEAHLLEKKS